jgi:hypothetical protein
LQAKKAFMLSAVQTMSFEDALIGAVAKIKLEAHRQNNVKLMWRRTKQRPPTTLFRW